MNDDAPYWLLRSLSVYVLEHYGGLCERRMTGGTPCGLSGDCITEYCPPCAAAKWLNSEIEKEARIETKKAPSDELGAQDKTTAVIPAGANPATK